MATRHLAYLRLNAQLLANRIGWAVPIAIALFVGAALTYGLAQPMATEKTAQLVQTLSRDQDAVAINDAAYQIRERLEAFETRLASIDERPEILKTIFAEATAQGIVLTQGDYQLQSNEDGRYLRLQMSLPLKGTYPKIRAFVKALLEKVPAASIDEIDFHRESVKNPNVDAGIKLSIFFRAAE